MQWFKYVYNHNEKFIVMKNSTFNSTAGGKKTLVEVNLELMLGVYYE